MIKLSQKFDVIVIDIEAHMKSEHNQKPYHIAWTRSNALDKTAPMECYEWYVKEFLHPTMWKHTFTDKNTGERRDWKIDSRADSVMKRAMDNPSLVKPLAEIYELLQMQISVSDAIGSYNWSYDSKALDIGYRALNHTDFLSNTKHTPFCLLDCFANKIVNKDYFKFIDELPKYEKEQYKSKSGKNLGYSAEIMARYVNRDHFYIEEHTALNDAKIEMALLKHFISKQKKSFFDDFLGKPKFVSWTKIRDRLSSAEKMRQRKGNETNKGLTARQIAEKESLQLEFKL